MEKAAEGPGADLENIGNRQRAGALLHPLRQRLLSLSKEPASASELARRLGLPRQRVNYHVRKLESAGFLKPAGRARKGNMIEQKYVATARAYVLSPGLLGPIGADWRDIADTASADYLLALAEQVRSDVGRAAEEAETDGKRIATLSLKSQFRFDSLGQRTDFSNAVRTAVIDVIARYSSPNRLENGRPGKGRPFRLVLACYPVPTEADEAAR
jgi:DNA-binding transcriptional ArsR family regulator